MSKNRTIRDQFLPLSIPATAKMPSKGKLNQALERVKGKDHYLDKEKEKQKKLRKAAEKKKRTKEAEKAESEPEEEQEEEVNGAATSLIDDEAEDSEGEESDEEDGGVQVGSKHANSSMI